MRPENVARRMFDMATVEGRWAAGRKAAAGRDLVDPGRGSRDRDQQPLRFIQVGEGLQEQLRVGMLAICRRLQISESLERAPVDLPEVGLGEFVDEYQPPRVFVRFEPIEDVVLQLGCRGGGGSNDERHRLE